MGKSENGGNSQGQQMRITPSERALISNTFKSQDELLRVMRKIFLPELDPKAPLGQIIDLWMTIKQEGLSPEEKLINIQARNQLIMHIEQCLMQLQLIAETEDETPEQALERLKKDSAK